MTPERHLDLVNLMAKAIARGQGYQLNSMFPGPRSVVERDARSAMDALLPHITGAERDQHWEDAVEWLLNSRHLDLDAGDAFWMLSQGLCTEDEADRGAMDDGTTIRHARALRSEQ